MDPFESRLLSSRRSPPRTQSPGSILDTLRSVSPPPPPPPASQPLDDDLDTIRIHLEAVQAERENLLRRSGDLLTTADVTSRRVTDLEDEIARLKRELRQKDEEITRLRQIAENERERANRHIADLQHAKSRMMQEADEKEKAEVLRRGVEEQLRSAERTMQTCVPRADYEKLQGEYNNLLHSSLSLQREAAQLRAEMIDRQSRDDRSERLRMQQERSAVEQQCQSQVVALQKRLENLKEEHYQQMTQLQSHFDEEMKEAQRRLTDSLPQPEAQKLRIQLREAMTELAATKRERDMLRENSQRTVPLSALEEAEEQLARRAKQLQEVTSELASEQKHRRKERERLETAVRQVQELTNSVAVLQADKARLESDLSGATQRLGMEREQCQAARDKHGLLQRYYEEATQATSKLQADHADLLKSLQAETSAKEALLHEKRDLESRVNDLTLSAQRQAGELQQSQMALDNATRRVAQMEAEQAKSDGVLEVTKSENRELKRLIETLKDQVEELELKRAQLADAQAKSTKTTTELLECQQQLSRLRNALDEAERDREATHKMVSGLRDQVTRAESDVEQKEKRLQQYQAFLDSHLQPMVSAARDKGFLKT